MKKILYLLLLGVVCLGPVSCKKDDPAPSTPTPTLATAPEAKVENDNKSGGVYKGTFANSTSSGTIKIVLQDGKTEATVVYNGVTRTLTTTALSGWISGELIDNALFTSSDWQMIFSAEADASSFSFGLNLAGVSSFTGVIVKELSAAQVKVYEGTFAGDSSGKWNFCTQTNLLTGVFTGTSSGSFDGVITGTSIAIFSTSSGITGSGTFTNDATNCSGSWEGSGDTGTWSGSRTL